METTLSGRPPSVESRLEAMLSPATEESAQELEADLESYDEPDFQPPGEQLDREPDDEVSDDSYEDSEDEPAIATAPSWDPITIVADGSEYLVQDREEAIRLLQLGKTFNKRNEALIAERRELEPLKQDLYQQREQYLAALPQLAQMLEASAGPEPDPAHYADRSEYLFAKDQWNTQRAHLQAVQAEQARVLQEQQAVQQQQVAKFRESEQGQLLSKLPEWKDEETAKKEARQIAEYGMAMGLTEADLGQVYDHRMVLILRDAMRYRSLQNAGQVKARNAQAKTAAPNTQGAQGRDNRSRKSRKQRQRLRQSGRLEDAAPLIMQAMGLE